MLMMMPYTKKSCYTFHEITDRDLMSIVAIDECGMHDCGANGQCTNNAGSFTCTCKEGFEGNGKTCQGDNYVVINYLLTQSEVFSRKDGKLHNVISCLLHGFRFLKPCNEN